MSQLKIIAECYIWSKGLYGAETWTFQKVDQKYLGCFKMDVGEGWR
jgi:hypothetical protein